MRYTYSVSNPADDYLITPGIKLASGKSYKLSFTLWKEIESYNETIEILYGNSTEISTLNKVKDISEISINQETFQVIVPAIKNGAHYFAIKATSPRNQFMIYVDNIAVEEYGTASVPATIRSEERREGKECRLWCSSWLSMWH